MMERQERNRVIGKRVREIREYQKLSREHLAEKADISTQFLADIEMGRKSMTTSTLCNISAALMVTTDYLLFGRTKEEKHAPLMEMIQSLNTEEQNIAEEMLKLLIKSFSLKRDPPTP
ncbi:MAG: helix-turn-helix domain-containing protein [Clostridia bacterium]